MCGLNFIFGSGANADTISAMANAQAHRGPDKLFSGMMEEGLAFGHNRLSIIDVSDDGSQPMASASGRYTIVFNGEIYNYKEIRAELSGYPYKSQSDTEVLLAAWEKWGVAALPKFIGMFALAIWDKTDRTLTIARDWVGIKPLYLAFKDQTLYGGSEIKSLLKGGIPARADWEIWGDYLKFGIYNHSTRTFFAGITALTPGHYMVIAEENLKNERLPEAKAYWSVPEKRDMFKGTEADLSEDLWARLEQNVRLHIRSDVPLGLNLSGGMDSATLCLLMDKLLDGDQPLACYTMGYGHPDYDEIIYADAIPKTRAWERHEVIFTPQEAQDNFERDLYCMEEPVGGVATQAYKKLHEVARSHGVKVLLEGQGIDELLGGYGHYKSLLGAAKNENTVTSKDGTPLFYQDNSKFLAPELILPRSPVRHSALRDFDQPFDTAVENAMVADLFHRRVPRVLRMNDRVSMAHSVELREPFLTHDLAEFCWKIPVEYKVKPHQSKSILKTCLDSRAPDFAKTCEKKRGVSAPQREWLRYHMVDFVQDTLRSKSFAELGVFDVGGVHESYADFLKHGAENSFYIWQWVNIAKWFEIFKASA